MKAFQMVVSLVIVGIAMALGYHFMASSSLGVRVGQQEEKLLQVSTTAERHEQTIVDQGKQIEAVKTGVSEHSKQLEALEKRVTEAEARILEKEKEIKAVEESATKDRGRIDLLEGDLAKLKADYEQSLRDLQAFRKQYLTRDEEIERRLKELENRAKVTPPAP
jgi:chromosome segregation ATPase